MLHADSLNIVLNSCFLGLLQTKSYATQVQIRPVQIRPDRIHTATNYDT